MTTLPVPQHSGATRSFADRHIGPDEAEQTHMLKTLGFASLEELMDAAVPRAIRSADELQLPEPSSEEDAAAELREIAARNRVLEPMIGLGYSGTVTPAVIR